MSRPIRVSPGTKRSRDASKQAWLKRRAQQAEREQRAFDRAARRIVSWGRSR